MEKSQRCAFSKLHVVFGRKYKKDDIALYLKAIANREIFVSWWEAKTLQLASVWSFCLSGRGGFSAVASFTFGSIRELFSGLC